MSGETGFPEFICPWRQQRWGQPAWGLVEGFATGSHLEARCSKVRRYRALALVRCPSVASPQRSVGVGGWGLDGGAACSRGM